MTVTPKTFVAETALSAPSTVIADEVAVMLAKSHFDIDGTAKRLATEKDDTFLLRSRQDRKYILKIANAAENPVEISFQIDLLQYIAAVNPNLPVPRAMADRNNKLQFSYTDSAGRRRQVHLLTYQEGIPLSEVTPSVHQREKVGEALAALRLAMAGYSHEADSRVVAWDIKHLAKLTSLLGEIGDPDRRRLLETGLDRFATIRDRLAKCRTQVLHNDFSKSNIVVSKSDERFVTGIIDFGDAVRTAIAIDVSTALLGQLPMHEVDDFFAHGFDVLRGYLRVADLTDEEIDLMPHLVMGRIVARALLTIWRARLFPENAQYILRNTNQGWHQLHWFMARSMDVISDDFSRRAKH
jgi:hydroxylysine kinase